MFHQSKIEYIYVRICIRVHNNFHLGYLALFIPEHLARALSRVGKIDLFFEIEIIIGFVHISGIEFTSKQIINNEHSKYVKIIISIDQHSNCKLSFGAFSGEMKFAFFLYTRSIS